MTVRWCSVLLLFLSGCPGSARTLAIDLRTDYVPGVEASEAIIAVDGDEERTAALAIGDDLIDGVRVAELELDSAQARVTVTLRQNGRDVGERELIVELDENRVVTAVITRDCEGVSCPEACLNGQCVELGCTPETPERCPSSSVCSADDECAMPAVSCVASRCLAGACLAEPVDGACDATQWCDPESGCAALPVMIDAGPADAGPVDAGGGCAPSTADCNGDPMDGCEVDLRISRGNCGGCGILCEPTERCDAMSCVPAFSVNAVRTLGEDGVNLRGFALASNDAGRVVFAGKLRGGFDVVPGTRIDAARDSGVLIYFGPGGGYETHLVLPSTDIASCNGVDVNAAGELWTIGEVRGTVTPPGGPGLTGASIDPFWASYSASQVHRGSGNDGRDGGELGHDVAALPDGGAVVVGYVNGTEVPGRTFSGAPTGGLDVFVARVNAGGGVTWVRQIGGAGRDEARGVGVVGGTLYVTGAFSDTVDFGGGPRMSRGGTDVFLLAMDLDGNFVGEVDAGGPEDDIGLGLATHASSDVVIVGELGAAADVDGAAITTNGGGDAFVARISPGGVVRWAEVRGDDANQVAHGVAVSGDSVYVAGYFQGQIMVGGGVFTASGTRSGVLARLDAATGAFRWGAHFDGGNAVALGVGAIGADGVVVGGHYTGTVDFGEGPVSSAGSGNNGFLVRLRER